LPAYVHRLCGFSYRCRSKVRIYDVKFGVKIDVKNTCCSGKLSAHEKDVCVSGFMPASNMPACKSSTNNNVEKWKSNVHAWCLRLP
jgi:hypothetical protein